MASDLEHEALVSWIGGLPPADAAAQQLMQEWDRDGVPAELAAEAEADLDEMEIGL
jgi:hypothetical protein